MSPYPLPPLTLTVLDMAGTAVFAVSGALVAARARQTLVTFMFFAAATGVGGGTLRDLLIGAPVFWMHDPTSITICLCMAVIVWWTPERLWSARAIDWFDGLGLAAYAVYGSAKAQSAGIPVVPAVLMGVTTGCMGGIFRDVLAGVPSIVIRPELYVTAAALASGTFVVASALGLSATPAALMAFVLGFGLRAVAITRRISLPAYRGTR